jgi:hypothetical protein
MIRQRGRDTKARFLMHAFQTLSPQDAPVVEITPTTPWELLPPLPAALVSALEDLFAMRGDTLYYHRDGVWYAVRLFQIPSARTTVKPPSELAAVICERSVQRIAEELSAAVDQLMIHPASDPKHP